MSNTDSDYPWRNIDGNSKTIGINSPQSINSIKKYTDDSSSSIVRLRITNHMKAALLVYPMFITFIFIVPIWVISIQ